MDGTVRGDDTDCHSGCRTRVHHSLACQGACHVTRLDFIKPNKPPGSAHTCVVAHSLRLFCVPGMTLHGAGMANAERLSCLRNARLATKPMMSALFFLMMAGHWAWLVLVMTREWYCAWLWHALYGQPTPDRVVGLYVLPPGRMRAHF